MHSTYIHDFFFFFQYDQLCAKGNFSREDIVTVLTANEGNVEAAFQELNKVQLKPFLMRIWGQGETGEVTSGQIPDEKLGTTQLFNLASSPLSGYCVIGMKLHYELFENTLCFANQLPFQMLICMCYKIFTKNFHSTVKSLLEAALLLIFTKFWPKIY